MRLQQATWSDLGVGNYVRSPDLQIWRIDREKDGWFLCQNPRGETLTLRPQPPDTPVTIMVPSLAEATKMLSEVLGAQIMGELEALAAQPTRATGRRRPFPTTSGPGALSDARGHIEISHRTYVGDVKTLRGLQEAHTELHADTLHIMAIPHHH